MTRAADSFNLISLGCPKNRVDSERILVVMDKAGFLYAEDPSMAGVIIINTCAFIEAAVEESIEAILDCRENQPNSILIVAGCLPLRYREDLAPSLPEVDFFVTPDRIPDIPRLLEALGVSDTAPGRSDFSGSCLPPLTGERILTTRGYAYLKIAEGCNHACRYCTIPSIRGPLRSADPHYLLQEAQSFASLGVRELVLIAQDLTSYGLDRGGKRDLLGLLRMLDRMDEIRWIRLMYLHPGGIPRGLGKAVANSEKVLPYLDIPFQHVANPVLKAMGRPAKGDRIRQLVDTLRAAIPGLVLRTTLMVGFPAEGEKEFGELRDFVRSYEIDRVGVFEYSPEEGTPAKALGDPVPPETKQERAQELRALNAELTARRNRLRLGCVEHALVEGVSEESEFLLQGRTWDQAPEVDGVLYITEGEARAGELHRVRINAAHGTDLFASIL